MKFFKSLNDRAGLIRCYGVTQESNTQNYALVLPFMENGSLRSYLNQNFNSLTWIQKLNIMQCISLGLSLINSKNVYGVMPYMAPEILRVKKYTKASDIYSFGIIMNEIISIVPPFNNEPHDEHLALD